MAIYQKIQDGIRYEQHVIKSKEPERVKELEQQGWTEVVEKPSAAKAASEEAPAPKAK